MFEPLVLLIVGSSFAVYAATSIYWMWILQRIPLSTAYVFLAITYAIVPLSAMLLFGETVRPSYWLGAALIGIGIFIAVQ